MPIKTRIDMLSTGIRTPIGVKIFGPDLGVIERIGIDLERTLARVPNTRSVYSDRSTGGTYLDIIPNRQALARYGLTVGDVQDVIEVAVGGQPIEVTVEGRNRFTINVRYPQELRQDVERLRHVLVPLRMGPGRPRVAAGAPAGMGAAAEEPPGAAAGQHVPLGQVADIQIVAGPPMIRDEAGMLVGYVYVDMDASKRDIGGYVDDAKQAVARDMKLPTGYFLKWTGQYELLQAMQARMRFLVPLTLVIVLLLLYFNFGNLAESLIVMCSVPFALVGSVWLMAALHYNLSTAVWVGIIALVGLATQTGVVMVVYCDSAYHRYKAEGRIRGLDDIVEATLEGSVQRVRPKLMTVLTMMIGLVPLLWSQGAGADVMKRVAAPMVGGLFTSAFLTLEIIPVVYTYWRYAQLKRERRGT
jgi:Cu(I)/Ag(I) efflux system membrane protein CusA/SilA